MSDNFGKNLARYCTMPRNCLTLAVSVGCGICRIVLTFSGATFKPSAVATCPMNGTLSRCSCNLSKFNMMFLSSHLFKNACRLVSCSLASLPKIRKSFAITSVPFSPSELVHGLLKNFWCHLYTIRQLFPSESPKWCAECG